jgi:hypothetical protein
MLHGRHLVRCHISGDGLLSRRRFYYKLKAWEKTVAYFTAAHLLSAAIVILFAGGLYQVLRARPFAERPAEVADAAEPKLDTGFKPLTKLVGVWIAYGALVILILVLSLAFVLWAIV